MRSDEEGAPPKFIMDLVYLALSVFIFSSSPLLTVADYGYFSSLERRMMYRAGVLLLLAG